LLALELRQLAPAAAASLTRFVGEGGSEDRGARLFLALASAVPELRIPYASHALRLAAAGGLSGWAAAAQVLLGGEATGAQGI
jgi:hypothetical protein